MTTRPAAILWSQLFDRPPAESSGLQSQIRKMIVNAILSGHLSPDTALPSSRELADQLGVSRNTVVLAYQQLVEEGFLVSRQRIGHFVNADTHELQSGFTASRAANSPAFLTREGEPDWRARIRNAPSAQRNIVKPSNWQRYKYPFIYGQFDTELFPISDWRESCMHGLSVMEIRNWASDHIERDDETLIEQIRTRVLPRRGVFALPDEIMVTNGCQQALYLIADLLTGTHTRVGIENPGYPDARNIFYHRHARIVPLEIDDDGLVLNKDMLESCDYVYVTPSHQCPSTVTMPLGRRRELLEMSVAHDFIIIEDDYESESSFVGAPHPALKSLDAADRVIYIGSLSKTLAPGLRLGYIVASRELMRELRALRRLMIRHPAAYLQRAYATFLAFGHHDALLRRLAPIYKERAQALTEALSDHLPELRLSHVTGGASCWIEGPHWLDATRLAADAQTLSVLIEPGAVFFDNPSHGQQCFRMGFSAIRAELIEPGVKALAQVVQQQRAEQA
jgi:GntR family transcriptional regulator / MocR family aminotransferase